MKTKYLSTPYLNACNSGKFAHKRLTNGRGLKQKEYDRIAAAVIANLLGHIPIEWVECDIQHERRLLNKLARKTNKK